MKKFLLIFLLAIFTSGLGFAQLSGPKSIPGDYASVAAAISDLNTLGVGEGGVTFNVAAGYTETFATPSSGTITTLTSSSLNPIVFQKAGTGNNPIITAATGTGTLDAIITIAGCDYVTFDGITLQENATNTTATTEMEWGFALLKASATDGSRNITIKNCSISLTKSYTATIGIYSNNHIVTNTTPLIVTNTSGSNSNLKIYGNTINNCYTSISLTGYADAVSPYLFYDQNNEIGKDGGNIITNVAGQATTAGYGIFAKGQNNLKVANNSITSTMSGSGSPSGIYLTGATNGSYEIYNNYVSLKFSGTGTAALNCIFSDMGATGTSNTTSIYGNTVSNCTYSTQTTGTAYMISAINLGKYINIYGNNITGNSFGSSSVTATGAIRYLFCNASSTTLGPIEMHDNLVSGNSRTQSVSGGGATNCIYMTGKGASLNMYNNTVTDNVISSNGGTYLFYCGMDIGTQDVHDNVATNISKAEGTTYGLYAYNVTSGSGICKYYRNKIQNIEGITSSAVMYGLYSASSNTVYFYNNIAGDFRAPITTGTSGSPDRIYGCYLGSSTAIAGLYNNTIYLNNTSTGAFFGSAALYVSSSSTKLDLRNNILVNNSTPTGATGKANAIKYTFTSMTNLSSASNYNSLYAGIPGSVNCIFFNGTTAYPSMSDYKNLVYPREMQSVTELPPFISTTPGSANFHIQSSVATQCEAGGFQVTAPFAINSDFDNDPRFPNAGYPVNGTGNPNAPDIGADEFGGLPNDITSPSISYSLLGNTYITTARTLTATITDGSGVPTTGTGLPVLYWKINSGSWNAAQGTLTTGSVYSFSFGAGVTVGDIVSYYIAAQDNASNTSCFPLNGATGFTANPPACATAPLPASTYTILAGISGDYHVGVGKDYTTLTAAALDISTKYINGPLTLILDDATYPNESYPIYLSSNPGSSAVNTLTIRPNTGVSPVFSAEVPTGLFNLNGIDYLTIDGSNRGNNSKDLTIANPNPVFGGTHAIAFLNNGGSDPATNITIKNCILSCVPVHTTSSSVAVIKFDANGGGYDNCILDNNTIRGGFTGIVLQGTSTNKATNCQIINNVIGSTDSITSITQTGIYMTYCDNTLISNNEIMGPATGSLNTGQTGINLNTGASNSKVRKNIIHTFYRTSDDGWGASGLWFATAESSTVTEISNNLIYDIHSPGVNPGVGQNITYGMFFRSGGNVRIIHNTINLTGAYLSPASSWDASSACLGFYYQATGGNFEVRNNILHNGMTTLGGGTPGIGKAYGIMISLAPAMFSTINNNDYFIDGTNGQIAQKYANGLGIEADYPTLASWQAYTGQEANSVTVDPVFTSPTNLIPTTAGMNNAGSYIPTVNKDITDKFRSNPPDIGAYEYTVDQVVVSSPADGITYNSANLHGMINAAGYTVNSYFDYGTSTSYDYSIAAAPAQVSGSQNTSISLALTGLLPSTTYHFRARGVSTGGVTVYGEDMTFSTTEASMITFNVDMSTAEGFAPGTDVVYLAGNFPNAVWNEPGSNPSLLMSRVGSSLIYTLTLALPNASYEYKYFRNVGWSGGEYTGGPNRSAVISASATLNDIWGGAINWANLQWPGSGTIDLNSSYNVYAQAFIPNGITAALGQTYGLQAWIGYSNTNTDPSTWTNWIPAPFFGQSFDNDEFKADLGAAITSPGTYYYASRFQFGNGNYVYGGFNGGFWNGTSNASGVLTVNQALKTLNVQVLLEGLYDGSGTMRKAQDENGDHFSGNTADVITIELHDASNYATILYTASNISLSTSGLATAEIPSTYSGSYYVTILHRNSIATTSSTPVNFAGSIITYNFDNASKAFGNNLKQSGTDFMIYGGDENNDGLVDSSDMNDADNYASAFATGYLNADVNGDGLIDSTDLNLIDNNSSAFISTILP